MQLDVNKTWILNTNNFVNKHFGRKYRKQEIPGIFRRLQLCLIEKFSRKCSKN